MFNYWPSALLFFALLVGICVCFQRADCMKMDEVKALISILFGFATSCLLLSFIWLIQRGPFNKPWPNQTHFTGGELPSMHPRGRLESQDFTSLDNNRMAISTISHAEYTDEPPGYKEALKSSRPSSLCLRADKYHRGNLDIFNEQQGSPLAVQDGACCSCDKRNGSSNGVACSRTLLNCSTKSAGHTDRKTSFVQLDVNQLMCLSCSPPKYHELGSFEVFVPSKTSSDKQ